MPYLDYATPTMYDTIGAALQDLLAKKAHRGSSGQARGRLQQVRRQVSSPPGEPRRIGYLYLLPALLVYGAFLLYPLLRAVHLSLFEWNGITLARFVGLSNYLDVVRDAGLRAAFGHAGADRLLCGVSGADRLALASVLQRARVRGLEFFRTVVFLPQVVAMVVVAVAWRHIYAPDGPLNDVLRAVGLDSVARGWGTIRSPCRRSA